MLERISNGRTDLVFDFVKKGNPASTKDSHGTSLLQWCAYYGDVSAIRFLVEHGERLESLGPNFDLNGAAFHGHWQLCQFLIENGANPNHALPETGESPLHLALSSTDPVAQYPVVTLLISSGANPNSVTKHGAQTGSFMRDCRTRGETPLHRAAAFAEEHTIQLLLDAGASADARDMNGDSPLSWASWYHRSDSILRKLCYGDFAIHPGRHPFGLKGYLKGKP